MDPVLLKIFIDPQLKRQAQAILRLRNETLSEFLRRTLEALVVAERETAIAALEETPHASHD